MTAPTPDEQLRNDCLGNPNNLFIEIPDAEPDFDDNLNFRILRDLGRIRPVPGSGSSADHFFPVEVSGAETCRPETYRGAYKDGYVASESESGSSS